MWKADCSKQELREGNLVYKCFSRIIIWGGGSWKFTRPCFILTFGQINDFISAWFRGHQIAIYKTEILSK